MKFWKCFGVSVLCILVLGSPRMVSNVRAASLERSSSEKPPNVLSLAPQSFASPVRTPVATRWLHPAHQAPPRHEVIPYSAPFHIKTVEPLAKQEIQKRLGSITASLGRICVVVHHDVYDLISDSLGQYQADLNAMGYDVITLVFFSGAPEALRAHLAQLYAEPSSLIGAVFVGEIPSVLFEKYDSFSNPPTYTEFPCDLFYMDLDGSWSDSLDNGEIRAGNGKYDTWSAHQDLEIWVCRLKAANLKSLGTEGYILGTYFQKDHQYRVGNAVPSYGGLVYNDDDWKDRPEDIYNLAKVFGESSVAYEWRPEVTTASDYKENRLPTAPQILLLRSHGYSNGHGFFYDNRKQFDFVNDSDYRMLDPQTPFFSLYVCAGSDYTSPDYLSGTIALNPNDAGLFVWGTTNTGGMWDEDLFYDALAQGRTFGDAFKEWFNAELTRYPPDLVRDWWYGLALTGDAALKPVTAASPSGALSVRISPAEAVAGGAQWNVDGGPWQNSDTVVTGLSVLGEHTIRYTVVTGWTAPCDQNVILSPGLTSSVSSTYATVTGGLSVVIVPQDVVQAGARWRVDGGKWRASETTAAPLSTGDHALTFSSVAGWTAPATMTVSVPGGSTSLTTAVYERQTGSLSVNLFPEEAVQAGAQWRIDGGEWQGSGMTSNGVAAGPHTLEFKDLEAWCTPQGRIVSITSGQTAAVNETYLPTKGSLAVTIAPREAVDLGAQWRVDNGEWNASGTQISVVTGIHTLTFHDLPGWETPPSQNVTVSTGGALQINTTYTPTLTVAFAASVTSGGVPLKVSFADQSTGAVQPTRWLWEFGDGRKSTRRDPAYTYRKAGSYSVTLTVWGLDGRNAQATYSEYINAYAPPRARFNSTPPRARALQSVKFFDASKGSVASWTWEFGDGQTSTERNPTHDYAEAGRYMVKLTVSGPDGSHSTSRRLTVLK